MKIGFSWRIVALTLLAHLLACQKETAQELPLEREKFIQILADVHVAEAAMQTLIEEKKDSIAELYYEQIFTLHGVEQQKFDQMMDILQTQPLALQGIYQALLDTLNKREVRIR